MANPTTRKTHARKLKRSEPAKLVQSNGNGAEPEIDSSVDPKISAEKLNLWRLNSKGAVYYAPTKSGDFREMSGGRVPIQVTVTGAAGQIGYALLFRVASGQMFGAYMRALVASTRDPRPATSSGPKAKASWMSGGAAWPSE